MGVCCVMEEKIEQAPQNDLEPVIHCLVSLVENPRGHNDGIGNHIHRVQHYVRTLAASLLDRSKFAEVLRPEMVDDLYFAAALHDIGMLGIAEQIVTRPRKLGLEELREMRRHTTLGHAAIGRTLEAYGDIGLLRLAAEIALTHHETWDGSGYPHGLKGEEIPLAGRLMAVADTYDGLTSNRAYKRASSHADAVEIIRNGRGAQFDPEVVDAFLAQAEEFRGIAERFADPETRSISF